MPHRVHSLYGIGLRLLDDAIFQPRGSKRCLNALRQIEESFQSLLEKSIDEELHRQPSASSASSNPFSAMCVTSTSESRPCSLKICRTRSHTPS
jgi:hypothetical protein